MKIYKIIGLLAFIILGYIILPNIYLRHYSPSVKRKFTDSDSIFLTFDDGPNPIYTTEILDILKEYNAKATFFVIANKVDKYKDVIDRIIEEGHTLGVHSYSHKRIWLYTPWQTKRDFEKTMTVFKNIDYNLEYFRPPWGMFNLLTNKYANESGLKSIFWTRITKDWDPDTIPDEIVHEVMANIHGGDIIVLHDSNHNSDDNQGAARNTIEALKVILPTLLNEGFQFEAIGEGIEDRQKVDIGI